MSISFKIVPHQSTGYEETVQLRDKILRQPLGLVFTAEQLAAEHDQIHIAGYDQDTVVACTVLMPKSKQKIKMRQVAVDEDRQRQGIGQAMMHFTEQWCKENGYMIICCHARDIAVPFYLKLDYYTKGKMFEEVTIPHYYMEKFLL